MENLTLQTSVLVEVGTVSELTLGAPGPNYEYGLGGGRPQVHF